MEMAPLFPSEAVVPGSKAEKQKTFRCSELEYATTAELPAIHRAAGVAIAGRSFEPFSSSTRQEISAMLVSIPRPKATHIASDSLGAVIKANDILYGTGSRRKPWMLQPDGDLWETFDNATRTKGVHAFRATWVKGHVTLQAMLDYPDTIPHAIGNGVADLVAGAGATTAGKSAQSQLLRCLADKQRAYLHLMRAIVRRVLSVSSEVRDRREAALLQTRERGRGPSYIDAPPQPEHPGTGFRISLLDPPPLRGELQFVSKQLQLIGFWSSVRLQPIVDMSSDYGTTWLELFAFFTLRGGCISTKQGEGTAGHRPRFNMLYKAFIRQSKFVLPFADHETRQLVRNLANRERPLTAYGVMSFLPMISSRLVLTGEAATLVHHAMLSIHGMGTSKTALVFPPSCE